MKLKKNQPDDPIVFDPSADEPRRFDANLFRDQFLMAARKARLGKKAISFIERNFDRDAVFDCLRCATQMIGWALAQPVCPDCGNHRMRRGMLVGK